MRLRHLGLLPVVTASLFACSSSNDTSAPTPDGGVDGASPEASTPEASTPEASASDACTSAPPPSGFSVLDPGMDQGNGTADRGMHTAMALDADGSPLIAYERVVASGSEVWFTRWDPTCGGRWVKPVKVDSVPHLTDSTRGIDIAYDASNGSIGIAYRADVTTAYELRVATLSTGTTTWAVTPVIHVDKAASQGGPMAAAIAMANGTIWAAGPASFVTGLSTGDEGILWSKTTGGTWETTHSLGAPYVLFNDVSLAVDSSGTPALAYAYADSAGTATTIAYTHLDGSSSVDVIPGVSTDATVQLAFDGTKPRVAAYIFLAPDWPTTGKVVWFSSSDDGTTWGTPVNIPNDQGSVFDSYVSLAVGPAGKVAVGAGIGGGDGTATYGTPKYATSADLKTFTTVGPALPGFAGETMWMRSAYGSDGKLQIAFYLINPNDTYVSGEGLVYWRE
jgi:hypothetical protein